MESSFARRSRNSPPQIDDATVEAVIAGCEAALEYGSEEVRAAARALLLALGRQIASQVRVSKVPDPTDIRDAPNH